MKKLVVLVLLRMSVSRSDKIHTSAWAELLVKLKQHIIHDHKRLEKIASQVSQKANYARRVFGTITKAHRLCLKVSDGNSFSRANDL